MAHKRKVKLIKVGLELYTYIRRVAEKKYGKGYSMPYYLYKLARTAENDRRRH